MSNVTIRKEFAVDLPQQDIITVASRAIGFYQKDPRFAQANVAVAWKTQTQGSVGFDALGSRYTVDVDIGDRKVTLSSVVDKKMQIPAELAVGQIAKEIQAWVTKWKSVQKARG